MGWKDSTRKALVGEKVELKSGHGELWIRPKKWGIETRDTIDGYRRQMLQTKEARGRARRLVELLQKASTEDGEIDYTRLDEPEVEELLELAGKTDTPERAQMYLIGIRDGIGEHNFADDEGKLIGEGRRLPEETIKDILDWGELAQEVFVVVQRYNAPLARTGAGRSATSPSGSIAAPDSPRTTGSSPTEPTPSS